MSARQRNSQYNSAAAIPHLLGASPDFLSHIKRRNISWQPPNLGATDKVMHIVSGGCHCGNIRVELDLSRPPDSYNPRSCDCDFCRKHSASYVSDAQGSLVIRLKDERDAGWYRQGSGAAECLFCRNCGVLVGAVYRSDQQLHASVNVRAVDARVKFAAEQPVSPQRLSASEKIQRWQDIWFSDVEVIATNLPAAR
jgi:hypothetical protein